MTSDLNPPVRSRRQLWWLVMLFLFSLLIAFALYYSGYRPAGSTNHGELITPARPLPLVELRTPEGTPLAIESLRGRWTLVFIGTGDCNARCTQALTLMRQTRLALGDDMLRVQRLFLISGPCCEQALLAEHAGLLVASIDATGAKLLEAFPDHTDAIDAGHIYVIDPLGNLMMRHAPGTPPKGLLEDLKKLLKLSRIG